MKIITWNTRGLDRPDSRASAEMLKHADSDVILLQEVVAYPDYDQFELLKGQLGSTLPYSYASISRAVTHNGVDLHEGLALLSRFPITSTSTEWFTQVSGDKHQRIFQAVTVQIGDKVLRLINLHLSNRDLFATEQLTELRAYLDASSDKVDVIAGDFNLFDTNTARSILAEYTISTDISPYTSHIDDKTGLSHALDLFMLLKASIEPKSILVVDSDLSDHHPILLSTD